MDRLCRFEYMMILTFFVFNAFEQNKPAIHEYTFIISIYNYIAKQSNKKRIWLDYRSTSAQLAYKKMNLCTCKLG